VSAVPRQAPSVSSPVLLVVTSGSVSQAAITRTAELAAAAPVTVIGVSPGGRPPEASTEPEPVRRAVALAMSVLENTGVMALGYIAVTGSPARAIARVARARGARVVVVDQSGPLAAELRRRMYGSGIVVVSATERGGRGAVPS
jgi:hypothetical protein